MSDNDSQIHAPAQTILFVEDEPLIRMDMAEFLRECGYRVHEAANAAEALEALQAKFAIDLVFTDINLPGEMNGLELAEWILSNRPGVKVVANDRPPFEDRRATNGGGISRQTVHRTRSARSREASAGEVGGGETEPGS